MNSLKIRFSVLGLILAFVFAIAIQSCTQKDLPIPTEELELSELNFESTTTPLAQDDPILVELKASEDVKHYNTEEGELLWDMAQIISYDSEQTFPLILVPIDSGVEGTLSTFVAAYNEKESSFHAFLNNFDLPSEESLDEGYTGTVEYKTVENISVLKTVFKKGEMVQQYEFEISELAYRGVNLACFLNCLRPYGATAIISGLSVSCGGSASCCASIPSVYNPCCYAVAGCALYYGGTAGYCAWSCWR